HDSLRAFEYLELRSQQRIGLNQRRRGLKHDARLVARARHAVSLGLELVFHQKVVNRKAANDKAVMRWHEAGTRQIDVIRVCNLNALHRPRSDFRNRKMMKLPARSVDLAPTALQLSIQPGARHVFHGGELDAI